MHSSLSIKARLLGDLNKNINIEVGGSKRNFLMFMFYQLKGFLELKFLVGYTNKNVV